MNVYKSIILEFTFNITFCSSSVGPTLFCLSWLHSATSENILSIGLDDVGMAKILVTSPINSPCSDWCVNQKIRGSTRFTAASILSSAAQMGGPLLKEDKYLSSYCIPYLELLAECRTDGTRFEDITAASSGNSKLADWAVGTVLTGIVSLCSPLVDSNIWKSGHRPYGLAEWTSTQSLPNNFSPWLSSEN